MVTKMRRFSVGGFCGAATLLLSGAALADRVALLPARGTDPTASSSAEMETARALIALGHAVVPTQDVAAAIATATTDGVVDSPSEYRALAAMTKADWVLV